MRITSNQLANLVRESVAKNTEKLYKAQETVSTQKRVNRPSDDPLAVGRILDYRTTLSSIDQYGRNIDQAKMQVEFSEMQLEEVVEQLSNAKNLLVGLGNGDDSYRQKTADDIQGIYDRLLDIANTKLGDNYIFGGYQNGAQPFTACSEVSLCGPGDLNDGDYFTLGSDYYVWFNNGTDPALSGKTGIEVDVVDADLDGGIKANDIAAKTVEAINAIEDPPGTAIFSSAVTEDDERISIADENGTLPEIAKHAKTGFTLHTTKYNGDDGGLDFLVSKTVKIKGNATGNEVFTGEGVNDGVNIFDILKDLKDALEAPSYHADRVADIKNDLINGADQVERSAVDLSVAYTRLESTENYWEQFKVKVQDMLSETEDADLAQAIVELQHQETVYEATLAASAKLFDKSLLDFLG